MSTTFMTQITHTNAFPKESPLNAAIVLADGGVFFGYGIGIEGITSGEICFNTSITGYQEILTDSSYTGQIITFTFPHIGNTGVNNEDIESANIAAKGLIIKENITESSNFRSKNHLNDWLIGNNITGICGIDTRAITRHIRLNGAGNASIVYFEDISKINLEEIKQKTDKLPSLKGAELAKSVTCDNIYEWNQGLWSLETDHKILAKNETQGNVSALVGDKPLDSLLNSGEFHRSDIEKNNLNVVIIDYGVKYNILRNLKDRGCKVIVVPADITAQDIIKLSPDGVMLSNGPGDPEATGKYAIPVIQELVKSKLPIFGICLGHQMLSLSQGCKTEKMYQGHRGANHPVQDVRTGKVEITSQNHGFVVSKENLPEHVEITHISLFDKTVQGIKLNNAPVFSVQGHPEASPGPHDSGYLFDEFVELMQKNKEGK